MIPAATNSIPEFKQTPEIVFQPRTARGFQGGINKIVDAIRPSLGPLPHTVAIARATTTRSPEILDSGGIIARRIISLPNRDEDPGAMYIRGVLWNLHERVGDGVATAAVLFQSVFNQGLKYIAAGGSPMTLRSHLELGAEIIVNRLNEMTQSIACTEALIGVAQTVCHDQALAETLGNLISVVGEDGWLEIRAGRSRESQAHATDAGSDCASAPGRLPDPGAASAHGVQAPGRDSPRGDEYHAPAAAASCPRPAHRAGCRETA